VPEVVYVLLCTLHPQLNLYISSLSDYLFGSEYQEQPYFVFYGFAFCLQFPYHVGLEFGRNRLNVIAEQKKRFSEVRNAVEKS